MGAITLADVEAAHPELAGSAATINWNNGVIYGPHEQITARIEATIDTLINEFAEAWTHSQGIGHPKYGAP
jgi:hypothetical protein